MNTIDRMISYFHLHEAEETCWSVQTGINKVIEVNKNNARNGKILWTDEEGNRYEVKLNQVKHEFKIIGYFGIIKNTSEGNIAFVYKEN